MMDPRLNEFGDELVSLISKYSDTNRGGRGHLLFISMIALMEAEKGCPCTAKDVAAICARFTNKLYGAGLVKNSS